VESTVGRKSRPDEIVKSFVRSGRVLAGR